MRYTEVTRISVKRFKSSLNSCRLKLIFRALGIQYARTQRNELANKNKIAQNNLSTKSNNYSLTHEVITNMQYGWNINTKKVFRFARQYGSKNVSKVARNQASQYAVKGDCNANARNDGGILRYAQNDNGWSTWNNRAYKNKYISLGLSPFGLLSRKYRESIKNKLQSKLRDSIRVYRRGYILPAMALLSFSASVNAATNVGNYIYNFNSNTFVGDIFYTNGIKTYSSLGANFTQNFRGIGTNDGLFIVNNSSQNVNKNNELRFGSTGFVGFISATFNAKNTFITGNVVTGNDSQTGGAALVTFKSEDTTRTNGATFTMTNAGTQNSTIRLLGKSVDVTGTSFVTYGRPAGGSYNKYEIGDANSTVKISNSSMDFGGGELEITAKSSDIHFSSIRANNSTGGIYSGFLDLASANYKTFKADSVNVNAFEITSKNIVFKGDISGGKWDFNNANGTTGGTFEAQNVKAWENSSIDATKVNIKGTLELAWTLGTTPRIFTLKTKDETYIGTLKNTEYVFGMVTGYTSKLVANNKVNIGKIVSENFTGGNDLVVELKNGSNYYDLTVGNINLPKAGIAGSQNRIYLTGKKIDIKRIDGIPNSVLNSVPAGELWIDAGGDLIMSNLHFEDYQIHTHGTANTNNDRFIFRGAIRNGNYSHTSAASSFTADEIIARGNSRFEADNFNVKAVEITAGPNWSANTEVLMEVESKTGGGKIHMQELRNGDYSFGQVVGYAVTFQANSHLTIDNIVSRNFTGGNTMNVRAIDRTNSNTRYDITVGNITLPTAGIAGSQNRIYLTGKNITINRLDRIPNSVLNSVPAGELWLDLKSDLRMYNLNFEDYQIYTHQNNDRRFEFRGAMRDGNYSHTADGSYLTANSIIARGNSRFEADRFEVKEVEITAGPNWNARAEVKMDVITKQGDTNIDKLMNGDYVFGQAVGYTATFHANSNINIKEVYHRNFTGGNTLNIKALGYNTANWTDDVNNRYDLTIDSIKFNTDGIAGSQGVVNLYGKSITVKDVTSCPYACTDNPGIRPNNIIRAYGENFYGGQIWALGLPLKGSDSVLDLANVTGTKFVDEFRIRSGSLYASNFHFNNFSVWKGDSESWVHTNIGKSFVNSLSTEIMTFNAAIVGDTSKLYFKGGGDLLNANSLYLRPGSYLEADTIKETNVNRFDTVLSESKFGNLTVNDLIAKQSMTLNILGSTDKIVAHSLNVNNLLRVQQSSNGAGYLTLDFQSSGSQGIATQNYQKLNVSSDDLQNMSLDQINKAIEDSKPTTTDYKNASGSYIQTNDGRKYVLLPGIMTHDGITNLATGSNATNNGNILIEQHDYEAKTFSNYGTVLLDAVFTKQTTLDVKGHMKNYSHLDLGGNSQLRVFGNYKNDGTITFRVQADPMSTAAITSTIRTGQLLVDGATNKATFDISPGNASILRADIVDLKTLANLEVVKEGTRTTNPVYTLLKVENGASLEYTYSLGGYTTTFNKDSISTKKDNGACANANCSIKDDPNNKNPFDSSDNRDSSETYWTAGNNNGLLPKDKLNPWDSDKANVDSTGARPENQVGEYDNEGNLIQKPSQSDKRCGDGTPGEYCGFGHANIQEDKTKTDAQKEADRGYDYAQYKLLQSFGVTYQGGTIEGRYLKVEKVVTDSLVGFNVVRKDLNGFNGSSNLEDPLCHFNSSSFNCVLYTEAGGNNSWIEAIQKESPKSYEILKNLFENDKSSLIFLLNVDQSLANSRNLNYFLEVGRTLDTAFRHVSDLETKSSTLNTLKFTMESAKANRLTKMASMHGVGSENIQEAIAYENYQKSLEKALAVAEQMRFAAVGDDAGAVWFDTLADLVTRFNKRGEFPNNVWINALGNLNFSETGTAQLYGFNAGYDYYMESIGTALGFYAGYGYGIFNGNNNSFISNNSNNVFAGLYSRTFKGNNEIDVTVNTSLASVKEQLHSQVPNMPLLQLFEQKYGYDLFNVEANVSYGYAFNLKKGYILKPFLGTSYYMTRSSAVQHDTTSIVGYNVGTGNNGRQSLGINVGLEGRKYYKNQSYIFLQAQYKRDVYVIESELDSTGHAHTAAGSLENAGNPGQTQFVYDYKGTQYRQSVFVTGGGEYSFGRFYVNGSVTVQSAIVDKNFGVGLNLGARFIF